VDRWNSDREFVLKVNLFPEKLPKTLHKCSTKVTSFINPPEVMENSDNNYTGLEVNFVELIFKMLNLTAQYIVSPYTKYSYYQTIMQTVEQIEHSSSDIAVGLLPLHSHAIAEATIPYLYVKFCGMCHAKIRLHVENLCIKFSVLLYGHVSARFQF